MSKYTAEERLDCYIYSIKKLVKKDFILYQSQILSLVKYCDKVIDDLKKEKEVLEIEIPFVRRFKNEEIGLLGIQKCLLLKGKIIKLKEENLYESQDYKKVQDSIDEIRLNFNILDFYIQCKSKEVWEILQNNTVFKLDYNNLDKIIFGVPPCTDECLKKALEILIHYGLLELFELDFEVECI